MANLWFILQGILSLISFLPLAQAAPPLVLRVESHRDITNGDFAANETFREEFESTSSHTLRYRHNNRDNRLNEFFNENENTRSQHKIGYFRCDQLLLAPFADGISTDVNVAGDDAPMGLSPYGGYRFEPSPSLRTSHRPEYVPIDQRQGFYASEIVKRGTFSPQDIQTYLNLTEKLEPDSVKFLTASRGNKMNSVLMLVSGQSYINPQQRHDLPFMREFRIHLDEKEFPYVFEIGRARKGEDFRELRALTGLVMAAELFQMDNLSIAAATPEAINLWIEAWIAKVEKATVFVHAANQKLADHYASDEYKFIQWGEQIHKGDQIHTLEKMPLSDFMKTQKSFIFFERNWGLKPTLRALGEALALKALAQPQFLQYSPDASNGREGEGDIPHYLPFEFRITDRTDKWTAMIESIMVSFGYSTEQIRTYLRIGRTETANTHFPVALEALEETNMLSLVYSELRRAKADADFDPRKKLFGRSNVIYVSGFGSRNIPITDMDYHKPRSDRECAIGTSPLEHYFSSLYKTIIKKNPALTARKSDTQVAFFLSNGNAGLIHAFADTAKRLSIKPKLVYNPLKFKGQLTKYWNYHGGIDRSSREMGATAAQWWPDYARPLAYSAQSLAMWDDGLFSPRNFYDLSYDFPTLPQWIVSISLLDLAKVTRAVDESYANTACTTPQVLRASPLTERHRLHRNSSL